MLSLRDYQLEAIQSNHSFFYERGYHSLLNHLATGLGKGVIAVAQVQHSMDLQKQRVLFLVHTQEIVYQQRLKFLDWMPELAGNDFTIHSRPGIGIVMNKHNDVSARVVLATPQTLSGVGDEVDFGRLDEILKYGPIDLLITDEAHHSVAHSYLNMVEYMRQDNPDMKLLGFTATPVRNDEIALGLAFQMINVRRDIRWGIRNGYLCDILDPIMVHTNVALAEGKGSLDSKVRAIDVENWTEIVFNAYQEHGEERPGVFFMPSVEHSKAFALYAQERGVLTAHIDGFGNIDEFGNETTKNNRQEILARFNAGQIQLLTNYNVLTEGWDAPRVALIGWARPTDSAPLMTQGIGRGTRPHKDKKNLLVIDFALEELTLTTAGSLLGHTWREEDEPVEDEEEEVLADALDVRDLRDDKTIVQGNGVIISFGRLFKTLDEAWYADKEGYMSLGCSTTDGLVIAPPHYSLAAKLQEGMRQGVEIIGENPDNESYQAFYEALNRAHKVVSQFTVWHLEKRNDRWGVKRSPEHADENLELLFDYVAILQADLVEPALAKKKKSWRYNPVTDSQLNALRKMQAWNQFEIPEDIKRGTAGQMISHYILVPKVQKYIEKLLGECGEWGKVNIQKIA